MMNPPRKLYRVYVDEAGDRGMTPASSPYFVLAAVVVSDQNDGALRTIRDSMCTDLKRPVTSVLHFAENVKQHVHRKRLSDVLGGAQICRVSYVVVDKQTCSFQQHDIMYNYAVRRLLERISWLVDDKGGDAIVTFAHVRRFPYATLRSYLALLPSQQTEIRWRALTHTVRIDQPNAVELLQLADIAASSMYAAIKPDQFGSFESTYLANISPVIYRRPPGKITSYGVNVVGKHATFTARLPWWSTLFP